ncbi:MAG: hypothetical protein AAFQ98_06970 [Bacteroidota bacterium]
MPKYLLPIGLTLVLLGSTLSASAQRFQISDKHPAVGDTLRLTYQNKIDSVSGVLLWAYLVKEDGTYQSIRRTFHPKGESFELALLIEEGWAALELYTLENGTTQTGLKEVRVRDQAGHIARNGFALALKNRPNYYIRSARKAHPDNYAAYRWRWQGLYFNSVSYAEEIIRDELSDLAALGEKTEEFYYTRVAGMYMLNNLPACQQALDEFWSEYPLSPYWAELRLLLENQTPDFTFENKPIPGLAEKLMAWAMEEPTSPLAQSLLPKMIDEKQGMDLSTIRSTVQAGMERPLIARYWLHTFLAMTEENSQTKRLELYKAFNSLVQQNHLEFAVIAPASDTKELLLILAREFLSIQDYSSTLRMLQVLAKSDAPQYSEYHFLMARAMAGQEKHQAAVEAYFRAYLAGNSSAFQEAKSVFNNHLATEEFVFDQFRLSFATQSLAIPTPVPAKLLPNKTLKGEWFTWNELQGKIVVLAFLAGENAQEKELIATTATLANALDPKESLFLVVTKLDQDQLKFIMGRVIPEQPDIMADANSTFSTWKVGYKPVYAVVDSQGMIRISFIESKLLSHEDIPLIVRALQRLDKDANSNETAARR